MANQPKTGTKYSAEEIHRHVLESAEDELERPVSELGLSGFAAGLAIGFSFLAVSLVSSRMAPENHAIAAGLAYPIGFIFVVMAAHQLFTENTLEPVIPLLEKRDMRSLRQLLRLWGIVLPANLIGAALFSFVLAHTRVMDPALTGPMQNVAQDTLKGGAELVFYKAIWAGWLIALMAWIVNSTRNGMAQVTLIWLTTAPIAAFGFKHSIAGATEAFYLAWIGEASWRSVWLGFEIPALLGNIIGGVVLVALVNHGQAGGKGQEKKSE